MGLHSDPTSCEQPSKCVSPQSPTDRGPYTTFTNNALGHLFLAAGLCFTQLSLHLERNLGTQTRSLFTKTLGDIVLLLFLTSSCCLDLLCSYLTTALQSKFLNYFKVIAAGDPGPSKRHFKEAFLVACHINICPASL